MIRTAQCCCGGLSIEVEGDPVSHAVCHCANCKRRTGSAFGISAYFPDAAIIRRLGRATVYRIETKEKARSQERHFCTRCGTTLYWKLSTYPQLTGIAGGCFIGAPLPEPTHTHANEEMCPWLRLPEHWQS